MIRAVGHQARGRELTGLAAERTRRERTRGERTRRERRRAASRGLDLRSLDGGTALATSEAGSIGGELHAAVPHHAWPSVVLATSVAATGQEAQRFRPSRSRSPSRQSPAGSNIPGASPSCPMAHARHGTARPAADRERRSSSGPLGPRRNCASWPAARAASSTWPSTRTSPEPSRLSELCGRSRGGPHGHERHARPAQRLRPRSKRRSHLPAGGRIRAATIRLPPDLRPRRPSLRDPRRPLQPRARRRTRPTISARSSASRRRDAPAPAIRSSNREGARPEIWSIGHRNVQSAALHPADGRALDRGARRAWRGRGQHPEAGKNYGWPVITYGVDYSGAQDRRRHGKSRPRTAGLLLGPVDRPVRHGLLHRRQVPPVARQYPRRRARGQARVAPRDERQQGDRRRAHASGARRAHSRRPPRPGWLRLSADRLEPGPHPAAEART